MVELKSAEVNVLARKLVRRTELLLMMLHLLRGLLGPLSACLLLEVDHVGHLLAACLLLLPVLARVLRPERLDLHHGRAGRCCCWI